jgi:hypothetical protein
MDTYSYTLGVEKKLHYFKNIFFIVFWAFPSVGLYATIFLFGKKIKRISTTIPNAKYRVPKFNCFKINTIC